MNLAEQIRAFEEKRAALVAANTAIIEKSAAEGSTLDATQKEEFDNNQADVAEIDEHLKRLKMMQKSMADVASAISGSSSQEGLKSRSGQDGQDGQKGYGTTIIVKGDPDEQFEGQNYTRFVIAKTLAKIDDVSAVGIAQRRWGKNSPQLVSVIRAAVAGGGTESGEWGAELVHFDRYTGDFIDFLYGATVFDQLPLREVPANVNIAGQDGAATAYWVGQSKSIPVSKPDFMDVNLGVLKVAALAVVSKELLRNSSPSAEKMVRDALVEASAQRVDTTFLSDAAAVANVSPAGILNGVTAKATAGNDVDGLTADIKALYADFIAVKNASGLELVTTTSLKKAISLMQSVMGTWAFPEVKQGELLGDKLTAGDNVGAGDLILLKPSDIYKIGDRGVEVSLSTEAAIEMADNPAGASDTPTANTSVVSMFQTDSVAIKVTRPLNFAKRRASAVAYVGDANYGAPSV
jgi:hypothetical protein